MGWSDAVPVRRIPPRLTGVKPGSNLPGFEMLDTGCSIFAAVPVKAIPSGDLLEYEEQSGCTGINGYF
jgi:hypothetical protein